MYKRQSYIYGPQKGVSNTLLPLLDAGMKNYGQIAEIFTGKQTMETAGAGAAGGLGFAFVTFLNGELKSGIDLILDAVGLEESLENADFVKMCIRDSLWSDIIFSKLSPHLFFTSILILPASQLSSQSADALLSSIC